MFAAVPTKSVAVTSSMLLCISPPFFQSVPFSVRVDGVQGETRTFSHVPIPVLQSVVPKVTFYSGDNRIQLFGFDFKDLATLLCRLGDTFTTPAYYHSSQRVSCLVPSFGIRNISVAIANNGNDFSSSFDLEVIQAPSIASIYPSSGPSQGGILVRMQVRDLKPMLTSYYSDVRCRFGFTDVHAVIQNEGNILLCTCLIPGKAENSSVNVTLVEHGIALVNNSVTFSYTSTSYINGVVPSIGPIKGSTHVTISINALNMSGSSSCMCFFGNKSSQVQEAESTSSIMCKTPAVAKVGVYQVSIFCNGHNIRGYAGFSYVQEMVVSGSYPSGTKNCRAQ
jgi:hypothetical protein